MEFKGAQLYEENFDKTAPMPLYWLPYLTLSVKLKIKSEILAEKRILHCKLPAEFILKPNERYLKKIEELYNIAKLNYLPWRSMNTPSAS